MKNLLKKSAVATAVAGSLMMANLASADSVLAPLVIGIDGGAQTYFSIKTRGTGAINNRMASKSDLHYVWFKKGDDLASLDELATPCTVSNNNGRVSPWDMVFQRATGDKKALNLLSADDDKSEPNGYTAADFVGFVTITDKANVNADPAVKDLANEGELSGFGYVVDAANSFVLDYKLLNNHRSKIEGDFSAGFISKKSVDFSWMPTELAGTDWFTIVTGDDMLKADSGAGSYDATVQLSQRALANSASPQAPFGGSGVYNNDEVVTSGGLDVKVTCMGRLTRQDILSELQVADTDNGGWKRMSIQNATTRTGGVATTMVASGAIIYKSEVITFPELADDRSGSAEGLVSDASVIDTFATGTAGTKSVVSFQVETSGHLSNTPEAHPNRPY